YRGDGVPTLPAPVGGKGPHTPWFEGSGGNIAVLTGADGKVFIDAGITASRPRILKAANSLSRDPIRHLINTHWQSCCSLDHLVGAHKECPRDRQPYRPHGSTSALLCVLMRGQY